MGGASDGAGGCGRPARNQQLPYALLQLVRRLLLSHWGATLPGRGQLAGGRHEELLVLKPCFLDQIDSAEQSKSCERHDSERHIGQLESAFHSFKCTHCLQGWDAGMAGCVRGDGGFPPDAPQMHAVHPAADAPGMRHERRVRSFSR